MSDEDLEIFRAWWPDVVAPVRRVYYDAGVGEGTPIANPDQEEERYLRMWRRNTQKRIDLIAELDAEIWIVELRHAATSNAVGRLKMYELLWKADQKIAKPLKLFLVSNHYDPDLLLLCQANGITYNWVSLL